MNAPAIRLYDAGDCAEKLRFADARAFLKRLPDLKRRFGFPDEHPAWSGPHGRKLWPGPAVDAWILTPAYAHMLEALTGETPPAPAADDGDDWTARLAAQARQSRKGVSQ